MNNSKPLRLNCSISSIKEFGLQLFGCLYSEASAYAVVGSSGNISELKLFDTSFGHDVLEREWPEGSRIIVYSNHPEGNLTPTMEDLRNMEFVPDASLYIVCEDACMMVR